MTTKSKQKRKPAPKLTDAEQHARFVEAAKKAEASESPDALDKAFDKLNVKNAVTSRKSPSGRN